MDFFESQVEARRRTRRLVLLFALAVASMIAVVYLTLVVVLGFAGGLPLAAGSPGSDWLHPELLVAVTIGMGAIIGLGSAFRSAQLRRGGSAVAELLGGRPVPPDTDDPLERRLRNVVEEMSIAAGIPVPAVYVLDRETGINAFAAGHTIHDAAVGFTRGSLEALDRDELQGVVAHEFSHILNGDMRLNLRLVGLLFGILLLTVVGRGILRGSAGSGRGRGGRGGGPQLAIVGLALIVMGYLGVLFGRVIQAAVSRQREYLADAAAVQFTRNPAGIAGALRKIGAGRGSAVRDHHAAEAEHLFFARGASGGMAGLLATHPPLAERIRRIDPGWDGRFEAPESAVRKGPEARRPEPSPTGPAAGDRTALLAALLLASVERSGTGNLAAARSLLAGVPAELREAVRTTEGATGLLCALLVSLEGPGLPSVEGLLGPAVAGRAHAYLPLVRAAGPEARLPLVELLLPPLRELPPSEASALQTAVAELIRADGRVEPFEFAVFHILRRNLSNAPLPGDSERARPLPLERLRTETEVLLSALARAGSREEGIARRAFEAGTALLPHDPPDGWRLLPPGALELDQVDGALERLRRASPETLRTLLGAAAATVRGDGVLHVEEVELLRAFSEALDIPLPPPEVPV